MTHTNLKTACFALFTALISCTLSAQGPTPAISTKYSDKEIADLIQDYEMSRSRDVRPTAALQQKFQQDFPGARSVEWETNDVVFEVEFKIGDREFEAYYDAEGNLLKYEQEIHASELPEVVRAAIRQQFPRHRPDDVERIVEGTQTYYKVELKHRDREFTVYFTSTGETM